MTATASPPTQGPSYTTAGRAESAAPRAVPGAEFSPAAFIGRHWLYLILCSVASGAAAYHAAEQFTVLKYNFEAQLLYNRIGSESLGYEAPWLTALTPIFSSRSVLDDVREEFDLEISLEKLEEAIEVEVPYESSLFHIYFQWRDREQGPKILDHIIRRFMDVVATTRNAAVEQTSAGLEDSLYELQHNVTSVRQQMQEFNMRHDVLDLERDLIDMRTDIELLEKALGTAMHRNEGRREQLASLMGTVPADATPTEAQKAAAKSSADLERWRVLRDLVSEEERRIQQQATLEFHEKEFERAQRLHAKKLISDADFDAIATRLKTLRSTNDPALQGLRSELESVEKRVPTVLSSGMLSSTLMGGSGDAIRTGVELSIIAGDREIEYLEEQLAEKERRMSELINARIEAQSLDAELKSLMAETERLKQRQTDLQNVRVSKPIEFSVVQPAAPGLKEVDSNRKKLLLGVFGACMIVLVGPLLVRDTRTSRRMTGKRVAV